MSDDEKDPPEPAVELDVIPPPPPKREETEEDGDAPVEWEAPLIPPIGSVGTVIYPGGLQESV